MSQHVFWISNKNSSTIKLTKTSRLYYALENCKHTLELNANTYSNSVFLQLLNSFQKQPGVSILLENFKSGVSFL